SVSASGSPRRRRSTRPASSEAAAGHAGSGSLASGMPIRIGASLSSVHLVSHLAALGLALVLSPPPAGTPASWLNRARALEPTDPAGAVTAYRNALDAIASSREPALLGEARLGLGMALRRAGRTAEGKEELERALEIFLASGDRCGFGFARSVLGS